MHLLHNTELESKITTSYWLHIFNYKLNQGMFIILKYCLYTPLTLHLVNNRIQKMENRLKSGENTGKDGSIYQEVGPRGSRKENFATIKDNQKFPPTQKPGHYWERINRTPDSKR